MNLDAFEFSRFPVSAALRGLGSTGAFNETGYFTLYPDVRKAVQGGGSKLFKTAQEHYIHHGQYEGRVPDYDEQAYLKLNPDVAKMVAAGEYKTGGAHFLKVGRAEGRKYSKEDLEASKAAPAIINSDVVTAGGSELLSKKNMMIAGGAVAAITLAIVLLK